MTGIGEGLTNDFAVKVICGQPNYAGRGIRAPKKEMHNGVEIFRVWGTTLDKNVLFCRLINMLTLGVSMFIKTLVSIKKNEEVLVVSAPPTLPFLTAFAARLRGASYTLIIQDKYPETLTAVGTIDPDSYFIKILERLNKWLYSRASRIAVVGRDMKELVENQLPEGYEKSKIRLAVIQNWAALEEINPQPKRENYLIQELNLGEKFVFLYAGNMGYPQDIESIVCCAEKLNSTDRFHFIFIGSGVKRKWLEKQVASKNLENITILDSLPRSEQSSFLNACDVGLVSLIKKMRGVAMPSRTYNLMAAGKPILALTEADSEVARVLEEEAIGWQVEPGEPEKLLEMIYKIYEERQRLPQMGEKARRAALNKYSVETAVDKYKNLFKVNASDND